MDAKLITCITNTVAANFTANVLLAIGAKPAMVEDSKEAAALASISQAVLINVGTITTAQAETMKCAIESAKAHNVPWVLDPVAVHLLDFRREYVKQFLSQSPTIIRGNHSEIDFLQANFASVLKGSVILATGEVDKIYLPAGEVKTVTGGTPLLQSVTATGCAQGAICAAFLGCGLSPLAAALKASRFLKSAGEKASKVSKAPGTFQVALIDALYELEAANA